MQRLLIATAALETATGIALLVAPAAVVALLLGARLVDPAALTLGRVTGAALLALGLACWWARTDEAAPAARGLATGLLIYDVAVIALLVQARFVTGANGPAFWPAILAHAALALGSLAVLRRRAE